MVLSSGVTTHLFPALVVMVTVEVITDGVAGIDQGGPDTGNVSNLQTEPWTKRQGLY